MRPPDACWLILQETLCNGIQPYYAPSDEKVDYTSFLFPTLREAKLALLEGWKDEISAQMESPDDYEDKDMPSCDGWIVPVDLFEDMSISGEDFAWTKSDIYGFFGMEIPQ